MRIPVQIAAIGRESPTVKSFRLDLDGQAFSFLPGQWVDCYLDEVGRSVAGFSITSSPLATETIDLAVKLVGENAVTCHLHKRAQVGDRLYIDGGQGHFYYRREMGDSLVLIGGGIGITPLMSIVRYVDEVAAEADVTLLYSAASPSELLFRRSLTEIACRNPRVRCLFTVTRPGGEPWTGRTGRIDAAMLGEADVDLESLFYVCGPPPMIQTIVDLLSGMGVAPSRVRFESWW